jgi:hypothetical protein
MNNAQMGDPKMDNAAEQREQEDEALRQWCKKVAEATGVPELEVDLKTVLGLAGRAAPAGMRPPVTITRASPLARDGALVRG